MMVENNGVKYFVFKNLTAAGVRHGISTRMGGVSVGPYESMNLWMASGDCPRTLQRNYALFCGAVGFDVDKIIKVKQVHGTKVAFFPTDNEVGEADGLATNAAGVVLTTYYADCVPLLFFDPVKCVIVNAHAGWRGVAANMMGAAVDAMVNRYGSHPSNIIVGIGPSISVDNFEVGQDCVDIFKKSLPFSANFIYNSRSIKYKYYVDLWEICREGLILAGLRPENIEVAGICTYASPDLFFSHRRDGLPRGSMAAMICL